MGALTPAPATVVVDSMVYSGWDLKVRNGCTWFFSVGLQRQIIRGRMLFPAIAWRMSGGVWVRARVAGHAFIWRARDRAWRWYCQKAGVPFKSLHVRQRLTKKERARRAARLKRRG